MTIEEALAFLQSTSWLGSRPGLSRITELMARLGDPQKELKFLHIAGTNGKGSTAAMLAELLTRSGYRTGLFTSPHLRRYNERVKVDGQDISDADLCAAVERIRPAIAAMKDPPTEFECCTALALVHFQRVGCGVVVLEVGLGGRLDATNVIPPPELAIVTNIGLEHTEYLGSTVEKIAGEKAGIIKPGCGGVVLYAQSPEAENVVRAKCAQCGCPLRVTDPSLETLHETGLEGQVLSYRGRSRLRLRLLGTYQYKNAAVVLDAIDVLRSRGWQIPETAVADGLANVVWPGRFQVVHRSPLVLVDGAHNPNGAAELAQCLDACLPGRKCIFVMGVMADKDYGRMLDLTAPFAREYITVTPESHRALDAAALCRAVSSRLGLPAQAAGPVKEGLSLALRRAAPEDAVCVFGSLYQVGEVLDFFRL